MVVRWACINPLCISERRTIKEGLDAGLTYRAIAKMLGRSKSTVQREARRFDNDDDYNPEEAQLQFEKMQAAKGPQISQSLFKFYETRRQKRNSPLPKSP